MAELNAFDHAREKAYERAAAEQAAARATVAAEIRAKAPGAVRKQAAVDAAEWNAKLESERKKEIQLRKRLAELQASR